MLSFAAAVILFSTIGVTAGAAQATPPVAATVPQYPDALPSAVVGVDDFVFESFTADYYLDVDEEGRSVLTTVETFVAVFPDFDQNRGPRGQRFRDTRGAVDDRAPSRHVTDAPDDLGWRHRRRPRAPCCGRAGHRHVL